MTHRQEGWHDGSLIEAIQLPYQAHPEGGLLVILAMTLRPEVTFSCPVHYIFHDLLNCWLMDALYYEGEFMPAVEIPADKDEYSRDYFYASLPLPELQPDEFWESDLLVYPPRFEDDDEYE